MSSVVVKIFKIKSTENQKDISLLLGTPYYGFDNTKTWDFSIISKDGLYRNIYINTEPISQGLINKFILKYA